VNPAEEAITGEKGEADAVKGNHGVVIDDEKEYALSGDESERVGAEGGKPFRGVVDRIEDLPRLDLDANAPGADGNTRFLKGGDAGVDHPAGGVGSGGKGYALVQVGFTIGLGFGFEPEIISPKAGDDEDGEDEESAEFCHENMA
jgi:hypothetical protein